MMASFNEKGDQVVEPEISGVHIWKMIKENFIVQYMKKLILN